MERTRFKLVAHVGQRAFYADVELSPVAVRAEPARVRIADDAFAWLKDDYGPDAWEWSVCDDYRRGARDGVAFALEHCEPRIEGAVVVTEIRAHPAHSSSESVACAAAYATWKALGVAPTRYPTLEGEPIVKEIVDGS